MKLTILQLDIKWLDKEKNFEKVNKLTEKIKTDIIVLPEIFATGAVNGVPVITYPKAMSIDFPNSTEFMGVMDFQRKVMVVEINDNSMRVAMFVTLDPKAIVSTNPLVTLSTTAMVLTFEVVK